MSESSTPWLLRPFVFVGSAVWALVTTILSIVGRILCAALGLVLMMLGALLTMTVVGAWVGIPLATFGLLLLVRSIF